MLKVEKRHRKDCRYSQYDRAHAKCTCAYRAIGMLNGVFVRRGLKTSNYEIALKRVRAWDAEGSAREAQAVTIEAATGAFMRDIGARNWQDSTKRKFGTLLEGRLLDYAARVGYRLLSELDLNAITEFRATWEDAPLTALKNIERLRAFFRFCVDRDWVAKNPAVKLKVKAPIEEKEPFTPGEFERVLQATRVIKFFLHLSKEEQRKRFLERIDKPDKNWKFSQADVVERKFWNQYMRAYEDCLSATSTKTAPWHVVPADDKYNARLIVSRVVIDALQGLKMSYPKMTRARQSGLRVIRKQLAK